MKKSNLSHSELISLMEVYQMEWNSRDTVFYVEAFRYFYATLIMIFLPNLCQKIGLEFENIKLLRTVSPLIGMAMSVIFLYVSLCNHARIYAIGLSYTKLNEQLPEKFQRIKVKNLNILKEGDGKIYTLRTGKLISIVMFGSLFLLGVCVLLSNIGIIGFELSK